MSSNSLLVLVRWTSYGMVLYLIGNGALIEAAALIERQP
jgi:hypothetical protein